MGTLKILETDDFDTLIREVQPYKDWILVGKAPSRDDPPPYRLLMRDPASQEELYPTE